MKTTTFIVRSYYDAEAIGSATLDAGQFACYEAMSQSPEGIIRLGALPHTYYDLDDEYQGTHEDTLVYLD